MIYFSLRHQATLPFLSLKAAHDCTLEYSELTIIMLKEFGSSPGSHHTPSKCSNITLQLKSENQALKARLADAERFDAMHKETGDNAGVLLKISGMIRLLFSWVGSFYPFKMVS